MRLLIAALIASLPAPLLAQPLANEAPPPELAQQVAAATAAAEAGGEGPFKAEMISEPGLPTHTVYRPRNLAAAARAGKLPIIAWGNGACVNIGNRFRYVLTEVASHGYLVIAIGPKGPPVAEWKASLTPPDAPPPADRAPASWAIQLRDAVDWAVAENSRKGSPYYGRLDTTAIGVMGQSCGGVQAVGAAAIDPRVKTAMVLNSGTFPENTRPLAGTADANKGYLKRLHMPVAWISGDSSDIAFANANADFAAFNTGPALRAWKAGVGHSLHWREPHGGPFTPLIVAWLDRWLKHRPQAAALFSGPACALCTAKGWTVERKGF